ncbi:MAG TPA: hypothetical protein VFO49_08590 [Nocardioides sp.]|nr:hypothetical protein [Nocardioides sp.]
MSAARARVRTWGALTASMGLLAAGAAIVGPAPAAVSAAPGDDCAEAFPVADLAVGDTVDGLTVVKGTTPTSFTGEVLGVIDDGIAADLDMVMVELEMPEFARTAGIWQGMSGSPVYAADGRLIGAVAYGLAYGPSPIAGVTPFEEMDRYLGTEPAGRVDVDRPAARSIARRTDVSAAQAEEGFVQLRMPMGMSGLSSTRLAQAAKVDKPYAPKGAYGIGRPSGAAAGPETVVAGGNLAASVAYGDVTMAGVGTTTSVCDGDVVGFGHPLAFLGETTLSLHPADALFVQPESLGPPFKVANLGDPAGTITQDRLSGISGSIGAPPESGEISSAVDYRGRSRVGTTHVSVPAFTADAVFGQFLANHDRVLDGVVAGTEVQEWTITGTRPSGAEFSLTYADRYTSSYDVTFSSVFDLADLVYGLSSAPGVSVTSVEVDSDVTDETGVWKVSSVEQHRSGTWKKITNKAPAVARAGKKLKLRAVLTGPAGTKTIPVRFEVPKKARGARTMLTVTAGTQVYNDTWVESVNDAEEMLDGAVRNDQLRVEFGTTDRLSFGGYEDEEFIILEGRPRRHSFVKSALLGPLDKVVEGSKWFKVRVR